MEKRFDKIERKIDSLAEIVAKGFTDMQDQMDRRFEQMDRRFEQVDKRFEQVDKRFEQVDKRFEQVDLKFDQIYNILDNHTKLLLENRTERAATISRFDRLEEDVLKLKRKAKIGDTRF